MSVCYCFSEADIVYPKLTEFSHFSPALSSFPSFQVSLRGSVSLQPAVYLISQP